MSRRAPASARAAWTTAALAAATTIAGALGAAGPPRALAAAEAPVEVHAQVEPQVLGLDDTATLVITAKGGGISSLSFDPKFTLDNLEIAGGPSRFEDLNLINGTLSRSYRYALALRPMALGPAHVRGLEVSVRGQVMRLPDQELRIEEQPAGTMPGAGAHSAAAGRRAAPPAGLPSPQDIFDQFFGGGRPSLGEAPQPQGPAAFLRAELQPAKPLAGEQAIYTIYLYTRQDVAGINSTAMPTFQGFWVRDVPQPERLVPEMLAVGGERYARVPIIRKILFPLRPGPHTLEPAACDVVVEPLTRSFFGPAIAHPAELHLSTPALAVDVRPLPSPPPGFSGVVGQVGLAAKLQPYTLQPGQAATLTVTLAGAGNLQGVAAPRLDLPPAITVFPPQQQSDDRLDGTTVEGSRTWTYVLVAKRPGHYDLRPHPITYFDPARREYRLAGSPPLALTALPPPLTIPVHPTAPAGGRPAPARRSPTTLAGLWQSLAEAGSRLGLGLGLVLAALALTLALTVLAVVVALHRRYRQFRTPSAAWRPGPLTANASPAPGPFTAAATAAGAPGHLVATTAQPPAQLADLEKKLKEAAREERPRHAAALVEDGWRALLAARWGVPATTPPPRWGAALAAHGAPPDLADEMLHLIEELHYLRYAPQLSTTAAVRDEVLSRSRQLLRRLR